MEASAQQPVLEWTYNPWREQRGWRHPLVVVAAELAIAALAGYSFSAPDWWPGMLRWGLLALMLLLGMTASLLLPVRYRLEPRGVLVRFLSVPSSRPWSYYRNYYAHDTGVHLTTMPEPSALDPFRGHLLLFARNRAEVLTVIAHYLPRPIERGAGDEEEPAQSGDAAA